MTDIQWLAALGALALANIGCADAQQRDYGARDGGVVFTLSGAAVQAAYDAFCTSQTTRRCDVLDRYDLMVRFEASAARLSFIHRSDGAAIPGMAMSFTCTHSPEGFACRS
ncbi:MAG: hypothetical protein K2P70_01500 [Hyphomonadaceae bacterium]|nr:hypothetical protein [Hyphomonadaceae bacterium]